MNLREHLKTTDPHNPASNPQPHDSHKLAAAQEIIKTHRRQPWHTQRPTLTIAALTATAALGAGAVFVAPALWDHLRGGDVAVQPADQKPTADPKLTAGTGDDESVVQREESQEITIRGHRMTVTGPIAVKDQMVETQELEWDLKENSETQYGVRRGELRYRYWNETGSRYQFSQSTPEGGEPKLTDEFVADYVVQSTGTVPARAQRPELSLNWADLASQPTKTVAKASDIVLENGKSHDGAGGWVAAHILGRATSDLQNPEVGVADRIAILRTLAQFPEIVMHKMRVLDREGIEIKVARKFIAPDDLPAAFTVHTLIDPRSGYALASYHQGPEGPHQISWVEHKAVPKVPQNLVDLVTSAEQQDKCRTGRTNDNGDELRCRLTEQ